MVWTAALLSAAAARAADPVYPVKVGPTGRYLVDQMGTPFLITGESPQAMIGNVTEAEATLFFDNRKQHGFNTVWINLLCANYTGCNADGTTFDGIAPFTTPGDLSTPNEAYFARADRMLQIAADRGFLVILDPAETGSWLSVLLQNGTTKARAFGQYLGNRYKGFDNIVWMHGNDFSDYRVPASDAVVQALAQGIRAVDRRHIHTVEFDRPSTSLDDPTWKPLIELNAVYTGLGPADFLRQAYNRTDFLPTFSVETRYEGEGASPLALRGQEYGALLSGATGQLYGNAFTWPFLPGWQDHLDTPGAVQMLYLANLFSPRRWYDLVPDLNNVIVTGGIDIGTDEFVTAAGTIDGTLVMAYVPSARTITVNMAKLAGSTTAHWFDPTNGTSRPITGSLPNSGSADFATPAGANSDGDTDWVLVLEAQAVRNPAPVLTGLDATHSIAGGPGFTLTATGANFVQSSVVRWKGSPRATTFVDATTLTADILASDLAAAGTAAVTVFTPGPGGGTSGAITFSVDAAGKVAFTTATTTVDETAAAVTLTVTRTAGSGGPVTVDYATADGSAHDGVNYDARSGMLTFGRGETSHTITVPVHLVAGGSDTSFTVALTSPTSGLALGTPAIATIVIRNAVAAVTSLTPAQGPVGTIVTLTGSNLSLATDVLFTGVNGSAFSIVSPTSIKTTVPDGAVTGKITVLTGAGTAMSATMFKVLPSISGVTPDAGKVGDLVTITGSNLAGASMVRWGAGVTAVNGHSYSSLTVAVPAAATTGPVSVTTADGTAASPAPFVVVRPPTISSVTPAAAPEGGLVTVNGTNLSSVLTVSFNGVAAGVATIVSATSIRITVPSGATTGRIVAVNPVGTATSATDFKVMPRILSVTPSQGPPGTPVTIVGSAFTGGGLPVTVRFGGIVAANVSVNASMITAAVPPTAPTARITVTTPAGTATSAADFVVVRSPTITGFAPAGGPVGSAVTISGTNLGTATAATLNGLAAGPMTVLSATSVRMFVPAGATSGKIVVSNPIGSAESLASFTVTPAITGLSPTHGIVGESVVIGGTSLAGATAVHIGSVLAPITPGGNGSTQITVTVPPTASTGLVSLTTPTGTAVSAVPFTVVRAPAISSFAPARGPVGAAVTISGANVGAATAVVFGGNVGAAGITTLSASSVRVLVPPGAVTGPVTVINEAGVAASTASFVLTPRLDSISPARALPGRLVTLTGFAFDGATSVRFGTVLASNASVDSTTQITVAVPPGAVTGKISVTTLTGTATSATDFIVIRAPAITSFSPASGREGTLVTLTGANLAGADRVTFNAPNGSSVTAITIVSATSIRVAVPAGAITGKLEVGSDAGSATSAGTFTVAPQITQIPAAGLPGTSVIITGTTLIGATAVRFGGVAAMSFTVDGPTQITATVPATAASGKVVVTAPGGTATSSTDFTVIHAPVVSSVTPPAAQVGALVTISGTNLGSATAVRFGDVSATGITVLSATSIRVAVPSGTRSGRLTVTNPAGSAQSAATFVLLPKLTGFGVPSGSDGDAVSLTGSGFAGATSVKFGAVSARFTVLSDVEIMAIVPAAAVTGRVSVTTPGGAVTSPTDFVVVSPASPAS